MLQEFLEKSVVVDTDCRFAYLGTLVKIEEKSLYLNQVCIYDPDLIRISLEQFLIESVKFGFSPSRNYLWINRERVVAVSLLEHIIHAEKI